MNFEKGIVLSFVVFGTLIAVLVAVCMKQEINLVYPDYYYRELNHGEKMAAMNNAKRLKTSPLIFIQNDDIEVLWKGVVEVENARLNLLRPSDVKLDQSFDANPSNGKTILSSKDLSTGLYRATLTWQMNGENYLIETVLIK